MVVDGAAVGVVASGSLPFVTRNVITAPAAISTTAGIPHPTRQRSALIAGTDHLGRCQRRLLVGLRGCGSPTTSALIAAADPNRCVEYCHRRVHRCRQVGRCVGAKSRRFGHGVVPMGDSGGQWRFASNGGWPASISNSTTPVPYTSLDGVAGAPSSSSGARYFGVPTISPITVTSSPSCRLAMPKSASFTVPFDPRRMSPGWTSRWTMPTA